MELNYHAGTACCTIVQSVFTEHVEVKFNNPETADATTAVLLISVCFDTGLLFNINIQAKLQYLKRFFLL